MMYSCYLVNIFSTLKSLSYFILQMYILLLFFFLNKCNFDISPYSEIEYLLNSEL